MFLFFTYGVNPASDLFIWLINSLNKSKFVQIGRTFSRLYSILESLPILLVKQTKWINGPTPKPSGFCLKFKKKLNKQMHPILNYHVCGELEIFLAVHVWITLTEFKQFQPTIEEEIIFLWKKWNNILCLILASVSFWYSFVV